MEEGRPIAKELLDVQGAFLLDCVTEVNEIFFFLFFFFLLFWLLLFQHTHNNNFNQNKKQKK